MNGLGQNGQFWKFLKKTGIFSKKRSKNFCRRSQVLTNCKVSEKSNNGFRAIAWHTDVQTYGRTWILRSPTTSSRDQKTAPQKNEWFSIYKPSKLRFFGLFSATSLTHLWRHNTESYCKQSKFNGKRSISMPSKSHLSFKLHKTRHITFLPP